MTVEDEILETYKESAERGFIYEWNNPNTETNARYVLVVSDDGRAFDKLISVLFLYEGPAIGHDALKLRVRGELYHIHADLVTYTSRQYLDKKINQVAKKDMEDIELLMARGLGIATKELIYRDLYNDLISRIVEGR